MKLLDASHLYKKGITFSTPFWRSHFRVWTGHVNQWKQSEGIDFYSQITSYCRSHDPQSTSNAFLYWYACPTELKPDRMRRKPSLVIVVSISKVTANTYVFSPRLSKHISYDSWSFWAVTRERGVNTFHMIWDPFARLAVERSYSKTRGKHVPCVMICFYYAERNNQSNICPEMWRKHIPYLQLDIATVNNMCYAALNR